jgi:hypothetical protein
VTAKDFPFVRAPRHAGGLQERSRSGPISPQPPQPLGLAKDGAQCLPRPALPVASPLAPQAAHRASLLPASRTRGLEIDGFFEPRGSEHSAQRPSRKVRTPAPDVAPGAPISWQAAKVMSGATRSGRPSSNRLVTSRARPCYGTYVPYMSSQVIFRAGLPDRDRSARGSGSVLSRIQLPVRRAIL